MSGDSVPSWVGSDSEVATRLEQHLETREATYIKHAAGARQTARSRRLPGSESAAAAGCLWLLELISGLVGLGPLSQESVTVIHTQSQVLADCVQEKP